MWNFLFFQHALSRAHIFTEYKKSLLAFQKIVENVTLVNITFAFFDSSCIWKSWLSLIDSKSYFCILMKHLMWLAYLNTEFETADMNYERNKQKMRKRTDALRKDVQKMLNEKYCKFVCELIQSQILDVCISVWGRGHLYQKVDHPCKQLWCSSWPNNMNTCMLFRGAKHANFS